MKDSPVIFIKAFSERDRSFVLDHFLGLSPSDRRLRFGAVLPDEAIAGYVGRIDFSRDTVFGAYERTHNLIGVGHLAFPDPVALPAPYGTRSDRVAEFGVSVSAPMRRKNVGTKLFDHAILHCRNNHVDTLYIHCLASNKPMLRIAEKAGMKIHKELGEVDGYLHLPAIDSDNFRQEHEEGVASLDGLPNGRMRV